jgi:hypothetical protein
VAGVHDRVVGQSQERRGDRTDDRWVVTEAAAGRAGSTAKKGVTREQDAAVGISEAAAPGGVARSVKHVKFAAGDANWGAWGQGAIGSVIWVHDVPQHSVFGMNRDWSIGNIGQLNCGIDVVIVTMGANDLANQPSVDRVVNLASVVCGIEHHNLAVVAHQPHVVGYVEVVAIEGEDAVRGDEFDTNSVCRHIVLSVFFRSRVRVILNDTSTSLRRMDVRSLVLCDFAQVRDGLMTIVSGGVTRVRPQVYPATFGLHVAVMLELSPDDFGQPHECRVSVAAAETSTKLVEMLTSFVQEPHPSAQPGEPMVIPLAIPLAINFSHVAILEPGQYDVKVAVGATTELVSVWFVQP